jgi:hypothetical protein
MLSCQFQQARAGLETSDVNEGLGLKGLGLENLRCTRTQRPFAWSKYSCSSPHCFFNFVRVFAFMDQRKKKKEKPVARTPERHFAHAPPDDRSLQGVRAGRASAGRAARAGNDRILDAPAGGGHATRGRTVGLRELADGLLCAGTCAGSALRPTPSTRPTSLLRVLERVSNVARVAMLVERAPLRAIGHVGGISSGV